MSTEQHESLKLVKRFETYTHGPGDVVRAERFLRAQHALIVQMAEALEQCGRALEDIAMNGADPEDAIDDGVISTLNTTFIAATQYLKGPKT